MSNINIFNIGGNADFEKGLTSWSVTGAATIINTAAHSGTQSIQLSNGASVGSGYALVQAIYTFTVFAKAGANCNGNGNIQFVMTRKPNPCTHSSSVSVSPSGFNQYTATFYLPVFTNPVGFKVVADGCDIIVDDMSLLPTTFCDNPGAQASAACIQAAAGKGLSSSPDGNCGTQNTESQITGGSSNAIGPSTPAFTNTGPNLLSQGESTGSNPTTRSTLSNSDAPQRSTVPPASVQVDQPVTSTEVQQPTVSSPLPITSSSLLAAAAVSTPRGSRTSLVQSGENVAPLPEGTDSTTDITGGVPIVSKNASESAYSIGTREITIIVAVAVILIFVGILIVYTFTRNKTYKSNTKLEASSETDSLRSSGTRYSFRSGSEANFFDHLNSRSRDSGAGYSRVSRAPSLKPVEEITATNYTRVSRAPSLKQVEEITTTDVPMLPIPLLSSSDSLYSYSTFRDSVLL